VTPPSDSTDKAGERGSVRRFRAYSADLQSDDSSEYDLPHRTLHQVVLATDHDALQARHTETCLDLEEQRERYIRLKDELKRVCTKSNEWKLRYKSERGSWQDAIHKAKCKVDALQARYDALEKSRSEFIKRSADYAAELVALKAAADGMAQAAAELLEIPYGSASVKTERKELKTALLSYRAATASQAMPASGEGRE
jgi:chromosome segregation ATPase